MKKHGLVAVPTMKMRYYFLRGFIVYSSFENMMGFYFLQVYLRWVLEVRIRPVIAFAFLGDLDVKITFKP